MTTRHQECSPPARLGKRIATACGRKAWPSWLLRCKFYRILARRYRTPFGEVDLIVRRGKALLLPSWRLRQATRPWRWPAAP